MSTVGEARRKKRFKIWVEEKKVQVFCRSNMEKGFFRFINNIISSERKLKLQIYPLLMMSFIFPLIFLVSFSARKSSFSEIINNISNSRMYFFMYSSVMFNSSYVSLIARSESYKAAWIYRVAPIHKPSDIYKACIKTVIVRFSLPLFLVQGALFVSICGVRIIPNLLIILVNLLLITLIGLSISQKELPFSKEILVTNKDSSGQAFIAMIIVGLIWAVHYGVSFLKYGAPVFGIVCLGALILMWKYAFNFDWKDIEL
jgi:hypothetical protein